MAIKRTEAGQEMGVPSEDTRRSNLAYSGFAAILLSVLVIVSGFSVKQPLSLQVDHADGQKQSVCSDTSSTSAIPAMSCSVYDWVVKPDSAEKAKLRKISLQHISSLHALTCQWAVMTQELSLDSTQLPRYVEVISDTLRLSHDAFAYAVRMAPTAEAANYIPNDIFLVGQVGDSLYYRDFGDERPDQRNPSRVSIRDLRLIDVPGAEAQYFWAETEVSSTHVSSARDTTNWTSWQGHILTYDSSRGIRHLQLVNVRGEKYVNGEFRGMEQRDISIPEPGVMVVKVRDQKGKLRWAPLDQLGRHVIDPTAMGSRQNN